MSNHEQESREPLQAGADAGCDHSSLCNPEAEGSVQRAVPNHSKSDPQRISTEDAGANGSGLGTQGSPEEPADATLGSLLKELYGHDLGSEIIERAFLEQPLTVPVSVAHPVTQGFLADAEYRAWSMLRFASLLPPAPFDEELASQGWYSAVYRQHSDRGLAELEAKEKPQSEELAAFHKLNEMGVLTQSDFYSPSKAQNHFYSNELDKLTGYKSAKRTIAPDGRRTLTARELLDQAGIRAGSSGSSATGSAEAPRERAPKRSNSQGFGFDAGRRCKGSRIDSFDG